MHTLAIIPARGGSKRVPRKNLRILGGKPLVARAIESTLAADSVTRVIVSSDDDEVLGIASSYNPRLALRRPVELSDDRSPAIAYVRHALEIIEREERARYETIVIVQPSSPLTMPADIDATVALLSAPEADTAVSVVEVDHALHPVKFKVFEADRLLPYFEEERGRRAAHELPRVFVRNCSVYATRRRVIDTGEIIGDDCRGHIMPRERSIDINDEMDLAFAEFLFARSEAGSHS